MRLIGLDPGLGATGWGVIEAGDGRLSHVADGVVVTDRTLSLSERLVQLADGLLCALLVAPVVLFGLYWNALWDLAKAVVPGVFGGGA